MRLFHRAPRPSTEAVQAVVEATASLLRAEEDLARERLLHAEAEMIRAQSYALLADEVQERLVRAEDPFTKAYLANAELRRDVARVGLEVSVVAGVIETVSRRAA